MKQTRNLLWLLIVVGLSLGGLLAYRFYESRGARREPGSMAGAQEQAARRPGNGPQGATQPRAGGGPGGGAGARPQVVEIGQVRRGTVRERVSLVGSLKPKEQVEVIPKITGRLRQVLVEVGDRVQQGQLLAELEGEELAQQLSRAEASLALAEANVTQRQAELENARAEEKRASELLEQGLMSVQAYQTAATRARVVESQLAVSRAQVRQANAELEELRIRWQQREIRSPLTGWVGRRYVHPGALVNPATPVVSILYLALVKAEVSVPERDLARLRAGNRATVSIDALGGRLYEGRVARISPLLDPATRSGSVEIEIPNPTGELKAEMFARIELDLGTEREVLLVPREAVLFRGEQTGVNILLEDRVQFRPVQTGISSEDGVEVRQGLAEGATVVTRGTQALKDGDLVVVQNRPSATPTAEDLL